MQLSKKTRVLLVIMALLVLAGSLVLAVSADEVKEGREVKSDLERTLPNRYPPQDFVEYVFCSYLNSDTIYDNLIDDFAIVDILLSNGYYIRLSQHSTKSIPGLPVLGYDDFVYGFLCTPSVVQQYVEYSVVGSYFFSSEYSDYIIDFSPLGVTVSNGAQIKVVSDYVRFRLVDVDISDDTVWSDPIYYGCSPDDFITSITLDDYCNLLFASDSQTTLVDWFFDTAFPVFGSVDDNTIDLGILGNYQPIQLYKFLFSLSLVVVAIVLFVWLPMYGLFRLLGIKRKKR